MSGIFSYNCIDKINEKKIFNIGLDNIDFSRYGDHDFMVKKYLNFEKKLKGIYMKQIHFAGPLIEKMILK